MGHDCIDIDLDYCGIVAGVFFGERLGKCGVEVFGID